MVYRLGSNSRLAKRLFLIAQEDCRRISQRPRLETFRASDWETCINYYRQAERRTTHLIVGGIDQGHFCEVSSNPDVRISCEDEGQTSGSLTCSGDKLLHDFEEEKRGIPENHQTDRFGVMGKVCDMLSNYAVCPLSDIVFIKEYFENPELRLLRLDHKTVKDALDLRGAVLNTWSVERFREFYNKETTKCVWSAGSVDNVPSVYYNYEDSMGIVRNLLNYQLGDKLDEFKRMLIDILECKKPKLNCMVIVSPPSAGKNFFFDGVRDYFMNAGQMTNPNKTNRFAYQDCYNKRILIWNGPNYESAELKNLKMLFGGDILKANVKYKPQAYVKRTPIIVLSNHEPAFCRHQAFRDLCVTYRWEAAPYLKELKKKPLPTACIDILFE